MLRKTELAQKQALVSDKLAQGVRVAGEAVTAEMVKPLDMVAAKHRLREQVYSPRFLRPPDLSNPVTFRTCSKMTRPGDLICTS